jgi:hypothetical protein
MRRRSGFEGGAIIDLRGHLVLFWSVTGLGVTTELADPCSKVVGHAMVIEDRSRVKPRS